MLLLLLLHVLSFFTGLGIIEESSPLGTLQRSTTWEILLPVTFTRLSGMIMFQNCTSSSAASKYAQGSDVFIVVEYVSFTNALPDGGFFIKDMS
jgi:hypothetical protein